MVQTPAHTITLMVLSRFSHYEPFPAYRWTTSYEVVSLYIVCNSNIHKCYLIYVNKQFMKYLTHIYIQICNSDLQVHYRWTYRQRTLFHNWVWAGHLPLFANTGQSSGGHLMHLMLYALYLNYSYYICRLL